MLIVDSLIISGVKFVLTRLLEAVEAEMYDESALREELLAAQMKLELGEISEDDFILVEREILAAMRALRARRREASGAVDHDRPGEAGTFTIENIDADVGDEEVD